MDIITVEEGEFAGWRLYQGEPFERLCAGPFYFKREGDSAVCAFRVEEKHLNSQGAAHGGMMMTFADYALFAFAGSQFAKGESGVTVSFASQFLDGPRLGERVEARGEVLRAGGSLIFVQGLASAEGRPCLSFSGTLKRIKLRR